jgi:uncharacterized SAM-binding protein YcdF (DUF218 family)
MHPSEPENRRPVANRSGWMRLGVFAAAILAFGLAVGFVAFADSLPRSELQTVQSADGIVVLTGGASRIVDAVELLAANRGKRLLISGVNPATTHGELIRMNPEVERLLVRRIDLGHAATNTIGNAVETGNWVRKNAFRSLIVVTSGWHMPRALIEIAHELPGVTLIAHPVVSDRMRDEPWWSDAPTVRLLAVEYVKYLASIVRVQLEPGRPAGAPPKPQP